MKVVIALVVLLMLNAYVNTHSLQEWKSKTIYQLLTDRFARTDGSNKPCQNLGNYCGGTYRGLIEHLDYIQDLGFDAIWVTPILKNLDGGYHGYWATDLYSLNDNFGTEQDFKDLVSELHSRGMWIMVDVVANHVAPIGTDYSRINPFNQPEHYHSYCVISDQDFASHNQYNIENCRLADLPDLNQDNQYVRQTLLNWIHDMIQKYNIDGIRIDTIPEVPKSFWADFQKAAGVYAVGEVFDGDVGYVADYQNYIDATLNYPLRYAILDVWRNGQNFYRLQSSLKSIKNGFRDVHALGAFVDNHDNARFLNNNGNVKGFQSALIFGLFTEGIPIVYYGSEQLYGGGNDPLNREQLWTNLDQSSPTFQLIKTALKARKAHQVWNYDQVERYIDDQFYAFSRGDLLVALTNVNGDVRRDLTYLPYNEGTTVCNIFNTSDCSTVSGGRLTIDVSNYSIKIYVPRSSLEVEEATM